MDDISVEELGSCPQPIGLIASNLTLNSADLNWSSLGTETEWEVVYGNYGFDPNTTGTTVTVTTTPPVVLSGLTDNGNYDVYVRAVCGENDKSAFTGPVNFTTLCLPTTIPYLIDFENTMGNDLPLTLMLIFFLLIRWFVFSQT